MQYNSELIIAIGGITEKIERFAKNIWSCSNQAKDNILQHFKIIHIEANLSVFVFYHRAIHWHKRSKIAKVWKALKRQADKANFFYVFYRLGENDDDIELIESSVDRFFDHRLYNLISIKRHLIISDKITSKLID